MLHREFIEIGYSGKTYDYDATIKALTAQRATTLRYYSQNFQFADLAPSLIQLRYESAQQDQYGTLSRQAMRSSIWLKESNGWQIIFHQATPTAFFVV